MSNSRVVYNEYAYNIQMPTNSNATHVRVFRFLQLNWTEILTGQLVIDSPAKMIKIVYTSTSNDHLIPNCIPVIGHSGEKIVQIAMTRLSKIQQDETDRKILYVWIDVNPFSFSFLCESKATEACQMLQLIEQNMEIAENEEQVELTSIEYIKSLFQSNPGMLSTLFINNNIQVVDVLFKLLALALKIEMSPEDKQSYFHIFKTAIRVGDKKIVEELISDQHFQLLLTALSWNPFNKFTFNYLAQYRRAVNFNNILGIADKVILGTYEESARIKFLRDVAACMFIEIENQRTFQNMLNINNQTILMRIAFSNQILEQLVDLSIRDPRGFISIFTELWETFKASYFEYENRGIKEEFVAKVISKQLHDCAMEAAYTLLKDRDLRATVDSRFHERWIQSLNPFLSYNWQYTQQWICSRRQNSSLLHILYKLTNQSKDQGLIQSILNFVRWFIEPSQNRVKISQKFKSYVYSEFIDKIWETVKTNVFMIEVYIDFVLKIYKVEIVRTRRMLIENKVIEELEKHLAIKSILICIIKLLDCFVEGDNKDIFNYLANHQLFMELKVQQDRHERSHNVINSCFKSLQKKLQCTANLELIEYFKLIGFAFKPLPIRV